MQHGKLKICHVDDHIILFCLNGRSPTPTLLSLLPPSTNSDDYPMIWKEIPMGSNIPQYISSTGQECCQKFYERQGVPVGTCRIEDVCNPPEIIPGLWHSSKYNPTTCTNSGDYPVSWNDETLRPYHLFETSAKCCAEVERKTSQACDVLDVEAEWSCDKWHLAIEKDENDFAIHPDGTCTNSGIIYDVWMAKQDVYVFPNHQACCDNFGIAYDDCHKVDECTTATTTTTTTTTAPGSCADGSFSLYWHPSTSDDILW